MTRLFPVKLLIGWLGIQIAFHIGDAACGLISPGFWANGIPILGAIVGCYELLVGLADVEEIICCLMYARTELENETVLALEGFGCLLGFLAFRIVFNLQIVEALLQTLVRPAHLLDEVVL